MFVWLGFCKSSISVMISLTMVLFHLWQQAYQVFFCSGHGKTPRKQRSGMLFLPSQRTDPPKGVTWSHSFDRANWFCFLQITKKERQRWYLSNKIQDSFLCTVKRVIDIKCFCKELFLPGVAFVSIKFPMSCLISRFYYL